MLPQLDTLKLSMFPSCHVEAPEQLINIFTLFKFRCLSPQMLNFSISSKNVDFDKIAKNFSAMCFTPGLKIFLVLSFFHSNKHHFCTCALFESFVVTVTPQWCAQGNWPTVNSLGIWVVDPARYAACWPLNFRMMCRISPILTSHCSKTVRWIMLHPYAAFLDQGS